MQRVIKGKKYIIAGNFKGEHTKEIEEILVKQLGIEVIAFITSDLTEFIEYVEPVEPKPVPPKPKKRSWFW